MLFPRASPRPGAVLVLLLALAGAGCGRGSGEVTGTVTYKDRPLTGGTVMLLASDGRPYDSPIDQEGRYHVKQVPVGPARVGVTGPAPGTEPGKPAGRPPGPAVSKGASHQPLGEAARSSTASSIPLKYGDFMQSPLQTTVQRGTNRYDVPLQ